MLHTILEVSRLLSISRQAVYKKLENVKGITQHVKIKDGTKYLTAEGIELIRQTLTATTETTTARQSEQKEIDNETAMPCSAKVTHDNEGLIEALKTQINDLKNDKEKLYLQIENLTRLNENSQILLKNNTDRLIMLEAKKEQKKGIFERFRNILNKN